MLFTENPDAWEDVDSTRPSPEAEAYFAMRADVEQEIDRQEQQAAERKASRLDWEKTR